MKRFLPIALLLCACNSFSSLAGASADKIKFPHKRHVDAKVECIACHDGVYASYTLQQAPEEGAFFPSEQKCLECHKEQKAQGRCDMCHTNVDEAKARGSRDYRMKISHEDHLKYVENEDCARCHTVLSGPGVEKVMGGHVECGACHKQQLAQGRCDFCHVDLARYPLRPLALFSHQRSFVREHATAARSSAESCAKCHDQTYCASCHASTVATRVEFQMPERVVADFIHRGDFVSRHALEAEAEPATCKRCHGAAYCDSCHTQQNLTPTAENPRNPHPAGYAFPGAAKFHGDDARRDIARCASCHDQGAKSVCVECHRVGGVGGNPHPDGWTTRNGRGEIRKNGMCLTCHL